MTHVLSWIRFHSCDQLRVEIICTWDRVLCFFSFSQVLTNRWLVWIHSCSTTLVSPVSLVIVTYVGGRIAVLDHLNDWNAMAWSAGSFLWRGCEWLRWGWIGIVAILTAVVVCYDLCQVAMRSSSLRLVTVLLDDVVGKFIFKVL